MEIKEKLKLLIDKYFKYKKDHKSVEMSEESTRSWINEFLKIFGWDILNTQQIQQEKILSECQKEKLNEINSSHTKPDYSLMNGNNVKAYLDAKKTSIDIFKNKEAAFQIRSYGWSACIPCSFLTNFEQLVIFDCRYTPNKDDEPNIGAIQIDIDNYIKEFDTLNNHFNRSLVYNNNLYKIYNVEKIDGNQTLDAEFNKFLSDFRIELANNVHRLNPNLLDIEELNYYVQIILDRIIFIRVCESKGFEKENLLIDFLKIGFWEQFKKSCYAEFYNHYDGAMFSKDRKFNKIILSNDLFEKFIRKLYYPFPYRFDVIPSKVIAKIYEDFLAYSLTIKNNKVISELKEDYVKTNGAIPTHEFIADAICKETIFKKDYHSYDDIFSTKVLDPCCGSGVFLISAYDYLAEKLMDLTLETNSYCLVDDNKKYLTINAKQEIMKNCLFGIDYDPTAVEVTKMSLALKILENSKSNILCEIGAFGEKILKNIHSNIIIGNTLVNTDIVCNPAEVEYIRPLNIEKLAFKSLFANKKGFDFIIGNPPYVETKYFKASSLTIHEYLHNHYLTFEGKVDLSVLFLERCMGLLNDNGILGMIIQRRWFKTNYGKGAREYITKGQYLKKLFDIETNDLFKGRITYVSIIILSKIQNKKIEYNLIKGDISDVQLYFEKTTKPEIFDVSYFSSNIWAPELKQIFEIKNKYAKKYGIIGSNKDISICDGIQALWKKAYDIIDFFEYENTIIGKNRFGEKVTIEKEMVKPVVYNTDFLPLKKIYPNAYRIFPYKGKDYKTKISIDEIRDNYPLAFSYLSKYKETILKNVKHNSGKFWHTYTREHNHDSFESAKIIIPMTAKETYATLVFEQGFYMDNSNVWFINIKNNNIIVMKALTMIINSTVFSVFGKCGANPANNGYYKFNKQFLEPIPLPNSKLKEDNVYVKKLANLFDEIKNLITEYENSNQQNKQFYKTLLETKWEEVDNCCFDMYEITEDERNLILSNGRIESRISKDE